MKILGPITRLVGCFLALVFFSSGKERSSFTLVLLPDTQSYVASFPEILTAQTTWVVNNRKNIAFVLQQGDMTDNNSQLQWEVASKSYSLMDGKVPYTFVPGNHDMGTNGSADVRNTDLFNYYFSYQKYSNYPSFGGAFEVGKMDNTWHTFVGGGYNWLIVSLEFGARDTVLSWAAKIIENHPQHKVILNMHAYLYSDNTRMSRERNHKWLPHDYGLAKHGEKGAVNNGEQIWEKLVENYPNIMFVFCGHVLNEGTGCLVSEGKHGNKVYQMLANYQGGVEGSEQGGNGYLRIITIDPDNSEIAVKTYSPYLDKYKTEPNQQFVYKNVKF
jgi:hypothetical protein